MPEKKTTRKRVTKKTTKKPSQPRSRSKSTSKKGLSNGAIAGIGIGTVVVLLLLGVYLFTGFYVVKPMLLGEGSTYFYWRIGNDQGFRFIESVDAWSERNNQPNVPLNQVRHTNWLKNRVIIKSGYSENLYNLSIGGKK
jgi:hypothetical protein